MKTTDELIDYATAAALCVKAGLKCSTTRTFHRYVSRHKRVCPVIRNPDPNLKKKFYHVRLVRRSDVERLIEAELASRGKERIGK